MPQSVDLFHQFFGNTLMLAAAQYVLHTERAVHNVQHEHFQTTLILVNCVLQKFCAYVLRSDACEGVGCYFVKLCHAVYRQAFQLQRTLAFNAALQQYLLARQLEYWFFIS